MFRLLYYCTEPSVHTDTNMNISSCIWVVGTYSNTEVIRIFFWLKDLACSKEIGLNLDNPGCLCWLSMEWLLTTSCMTGNLNIWERLWGIVRQRCPNELHRSWTVGSWYRTGVPCLVDFATWCFTCCCCAGWLLIMFYRANRVWFVATLWSTLANFLNKSNKSSSIYCIWIR